MLKASMYPVILFRTFQNLRLKKRIHATRVNSVAFGWEIVERLEDSQLISSVIRQHLCDERDNPCMTQSRKPRNGSERASGNVEEWDKNGAIDTVIHVRREHDWFT